MTAEEKQQQRAAQYGDAAGSGFIGGAAVGGLLAGRRGVIKGAIAGSAATLAARHAIDRHVGKAQNKNQPIKAGLIGSTPATIAISAGALAAIKGRTIGKVAKRAGESFRNFRTKPRMGKTVPMRPEDYKDVVMEPKPIAGLLKRFSERDELSAIIEFKSLDLGYTYPDYGYPSTAPSPKKVNYPSLYIDDRENEIDLPLNGTAKVKFKLRSKTTRQDEEGKKKHSASIEIQSIDPIEDDEKVKPGGASPLKLLQAELSEIIEFGAVRRKKIAPRKKGAQEPVMDTIPGDCPGGSSMLSERDELCAILQFGNDPRPRNRLGEFGDENTGINHEAIHATYRAEGRAVAAKEGNVLANVLKKARR